MLPSLGGDSYGETATGRRCHWHFLFPFDKLGVKHPTSLRKKKKLTKNVLINLLPPSDISLVRAAGRRRGEHHV